MPSVKFGDDQRPPKPSIPKEPAEVILERFAGRLQRLRRSTNLSQRDLARYVGTTQGVISHYELGLRVPTLSRLLDLARVLGVPTSYFLEVKPKDLPWDDFAMLNIAFRALSPASRSLVVEFARLMSSWERRLVAKRGELPDGSEEAFVEQLIAARKKAGAF